MKTSADRTCTIPDCERPHLARGRCDMHYARWHRSGDPHSVRRRRDSADDYLEAVEWLRGEGESAEGVAALVGKTPAAIARALYRRGRAEQARPFDALDRRQRAAKARERLNRG